MRRLIVLLAIVLLSSSCSTIPASGTAPLRVLTHDSFAVSETVLAAFTRETGITIEILPAGDAGAALNRAILTRDTPLADVLFGVDNTFLGRALGSELFAPYDSPALTSFPPDLRLDDTNRLLPVTIGYVTINYDRAELDRRDLMPPASLAELTDPRWRGLLVVQNPATSSPGLAFLLATIATFGETGSYTWRDYWRDLRANDVLVSEGWTDAYYTQFSGSSGKGPRPLVVSYATSPAAEVFFSDGKLSEPPTGSMAAGAFRQIEFIGILASTQRRNDAVRFVDFVLGRSFQADIALQMFVYPALPGVATPAVFTQFAPIPTAAVRMDPQQIDAGREGWIAEWTTIVLR